MTNTLYYKNGYTLLEVMIALLVFSILSVITSSVLLRTSNSHKIVVSHANELSRLQFTLTLIEQDIREITNRSINSETRIAAFVGRSDYIEFTRGGIVNPSALEKRSSLKRIALICQHNSLIHRSWYSLDSMAHTDFKDEILLSNLQKCNFAFLNKNRDVLNEWQVNTYTQNKENLPIAIQLNFALKNQGLTSLLFIIPESLYGI